MGKHILMISNVSAGLVSFRYELIQRLTSEHRVTVLCNDNGRVDQLKGLGCEVIQFDMDSHGTNPVKELGLMARYLKQLRVIKADIVLTYTIKPNVYAGMACAMLKIPYLANVTGLGTAVENPGPLQMVTLALYRAGLRGAQCVFFQNETNQKFLLDHKVVHGRHELIPGSGVNLSKYNLLDYPQGETVDFLFISRVMKQKGIDQYLETAKVIRAKYPYTRFHVCGNCDKEYEGVLKQLNDDGTIIYHGRINDVAGMHRVNCCTIHPTYYPEGMSNVLLESCACGRPIITTDRPGCREIVDDGVNGFVVKQKDAADLIAKVEQFLALTWEQRRDMGLAGRAKVERQFDRQIVINAYINEVEKV